MVSTDIIKTKASKFYTWLFPPQAELPEEVRSIIYSSFTPGSLDLDKVIFHIGLPWVQSWSKLQGTTVPGTYDFDKIHIYINPDFWDMKTPIGIGLIIHECFHAMQYQQLWKGRGPGYFRLFLIPYFSGYVSLGRQYEHYLEIPAYAKEERFIPLYKKIKLPAIEAAGFLSQNTTQEWKSLLLMDKRVRYGHMLWNCTPGVKYLKGRIKNIFSPMKKSRLISWELALLLALSNFLSLIWVLIWNMFVCCFCITIAFLKPVVEMILLLVDAILWLGYGVAFLFNSIGGSRKVEIGKP